MKKFGLCLILPLAFLYACSGSELKREEIPKWLSNMSAGKAPEIDVSGEWHDPYGNNVFGWGKGYLKQDQGTISGAIGSYLVEGSVSGKKVFLVFLSGGYVYYTARLEMFEDGVLKGSYFYAKDKEQEAGYPTALARKKD